VESRVLVLGAGFGGLELATVLSEALGDDARVTLIDESDAFVFGYSKLDVMFGRAAPEEVRLPYARLAQPGVQFVQETVTAIDAESRRVRTSEGSYEAEILVVALGADYDLDATPGLAEAGNEFYSVSGAERLREVLPTFTSGRAIIGVCGAPFKCPPAPSEAALLLHDYLSQRGVRDDCEITLVMPFGSPVPPSPDTSAALLAAFAERGIEFVSERRVSSLDPERRVAVLDGGEELPFDLFLGVPKHRAPDVVLGSGMAEDGYIPVDSRTLQTRFGMSTRWGTSLRSECRRRVSSRKAPPARSLNRFSRSGPRLTTDAVPATSNSGPGVSAESTWTFSPGRNRQAPSGSPRRSSSRRSGTSAPVGGPAGSAAQKIAGRLDGLRPVACRRSWPYRAQGLSLDRSGLVTALRGLRGR
jgi:sulfide:quinone oxidoreductase